MKSNLESFTVEMVQYFQSLGEDMDEVLITTARTSGKTQELADEVIQEITQDIIDSTEDVASKQIP